MSNLTYLAAAYVFLWIMVFGYLHRLARRQQAMEQELRALQEALERIRKET
jgi:CcmD family protein